MSVSLIKNLSEYQNNVKYYGDICGVECGSFGECKETLNNSIKHKFYYLDEIKKEFLWKNDLPFPKSIDLLNVTKNNILFIEQRSSGKKILQKLKGSNRVLKKIDTKFNLKNYSQKVVIKLVSTIRQPDLKKEDPSKPVHEALKMLHVRPDIPKDTLYGTDEFDVDGEKVMFCLAKNCITQREQIIKYVNDFIDGNNNTGESKNDK